VTLFHGIPLDYALSWLVWLITGVRWAQLWLLQQKAGRWPAIQGRVAGTMLTAGVELTYTYVVQGEYYSGSQIVYFPEGGGEEFSERVCGQELDVSYDPARPAVSVIKQKEIDRLKLGEPLSGLSPIANEIIGTPEYALPASLRAILGLATAMSAAGFLSSAWFHLVSFFREPGSLRTVIDVLVVTLIVLAILAWGSNSILHIRKMHHRARITGFSHSVLLAVWVYSGIYPVLLAIFPDSHAWKARTASAFLMFGFAGVMALLYRLLGARKREHLPQAVAA